MLNQFQEFERTASKLNVSFLKDAEPGERLNQALLEYPELSVMLRYILRHNNDAPVNINLRRLAKNGIVKRDDMAVYLKEKSASSTALKEVIKNPASFFFYANDKANFVQKKKAHFDLGTFAHMAFLEPDLFDKCAVEPKYNAASTEGVIKGIRFYENLARQDEKSYAGVKIGDLKSDLEKLKGSCEYMIIAEEHKLIIDILKRNYYQYGGGIIPMILKGAMSEVSFYGTDESTGIKVKVRPDVFNVKKNIGVNAVISFKTTSAPSVGKFLYDSAKFQYELSEGMYQQVVSDITGIKFNSTIMIMLQTVPPFLPAVFWWAPEDLENGKYKYRYTVDTVKSCLDSGLWPGFEALAESGNYGIINMQQPEWSKKLMHPVDIDN